MDNVVVGERIKELRLSRHMTREKLAEEAELSTSFLYEIETGKKSFSAYTLEHLSKALEVNSDYILLGEKAIAKHKKLAVSNGTLTQESLLCIQKLLMEAYNEIQDLLSD